MNTETPHWLVESNYNASFATAIEYNVSDPVARRRMMESVLGWAEALNRWAPWQWVLDRLREGIDPYTIRQVFWYAGGEDEPTPLPVIRQALQKLNLAVRSSVIAKGWVTVPKNCQATKHRAKVRSIVHVAAPFVQSLLRGYRMTPRAAARDSGSPLFTVAVPTKILGIHGPLAVVEDDFRQIIPVKTRPPEWLLEAMSSNPKLFTRRNAR